MKCLNYICSIDEMGEVGDSLYEVYYYLFEEIECSEDVAIKFQKDLETRILVEEHRKEVTNKHGIYRQNYYLIVRKNKTYSKDNSLSTNLNSYIKKGEDIKEHLSKSGFDVISVIEPSEYIKESNKKI